MSFGNERIVEMGYCMLAEATTAATRSGGAMMSTALVPLGKEEGELSGVFGQESREVDKVADDVADGGGRGMATDDSKAARAQFIRRITSSRMS